MPPLSHKADYTRLPEADEHLEYMETSDSTTKHRKRYQNVGFYSFYFILGVISCIAVTKLLSPTSESSYTSGSAASCLNPETRQEWRSLSSEEKQNYIEAVKCMTEKPSRLGLNQSMHDDFPWVHYRVGEYSHHAAAFLAWHRSFIHSYEKALQQECGYKGQLAYWDWTLDWEDITSSPVWSSSQGFGGDGNKDTGRQILEGYCVDKGPLANLTVPYIDSESQPHCLSRGFLSGDELLEYGNWFKPSAIAKLMEHDSYEDFNLGLEDSAHIAIPRSIQGDFSMLTAPSDPVFFLHHSQLDRLWWIWQQRDVENRLWQYSGASEHGSTLPASLKDTLPLGGLDRDVAVGDIILTEGKLLCYRY